MKKEGGRGLSKKTLSVLVTFILLYILLPAAVADADYAPYQRYLSRRYTISGDISLTYDRRWSSQESAASSRFIHDYNFSLTGFAVDPRFMTFEVSTNFTQEIDSPGNTINSYGINTGISVLNKRALRGFFRHFPQPINLTFAYYTSAGFKSTSYGISFAYDAFELQRHLKGLAAQQAARLQQSENDQEGNGGGQKAKRPAVKSYWYPLPIFYIDYNRYSSSSGDSNISLNTDHLDLRAIDKDVHTEYLGEYNFYRYSGTNLSLIVQYLELDVNYQNYWKEESKRLQLRNRLFITDNGGKIALNLSDFILWGKKVGPGLRDDLILAGGSNFFTSSDSTSYDVNAAGNYSKYFNPGFWNTISSSLNFGKTDSSTLYSAAASNELHYQISRLLSLQNTLAVGQNELGTAFGASVGLSTATPITVSPSYYYSNAPLSEGRTTSHTFTLDVSGRIFRRLSFNSQGSYTINQVEGTEPSRGRSLTLRADLFWSLYRLNFNIGGSYIRSRTTNGATTDTAATFIYSNISAPLFRRAFLQLNTTYQQDNNGGKMLIIHPILGWNYRLTTLTAEYEMDKTFGAGNDLTNHRLYFRLTRSFFKSLRGFL